MTTADVVTDTVAILIAAGWRRRWPSCANALAAPGGGTVSLHHGEDSILVEVEAPATTLVETLTLDPTAGAERLARIITATA